MLYVIRESCLLMNTVDFRLCPSGPGSLYISMHAAVCPKQIYARLYSYTHTYIYINWTYKQTFILTYM